MALNQTEKFVCIGGKMCEDWSVEDAISHGVQRAHYCSWRNSQVMCDRQRAPLELKVLPFQAEFMKTLLDGCSHKAKQIISDRPPPLSSSLHQMEEEG